MMNNIWGNLCVIQRCHQILSIVLYRYSRIDTSSTDRAFFVLQVAIDIKIVSNHYYFRALANIHAYPPPAHKKPQIEWGNPAPVAERQHQTLTTTLGACR